MNTAKPLLALLIIGMTGWVACEKDPGKGGLASISGKVYGYDYNSVNVLIDSGYVGDVRVYISYGGGTTPDDDVRTGPDGSFAFKGLQKGEYSVWAFTKCDTCAFGTSAVTQQIELTETDQEAILPDFVIKD